MSRRAQENLVAVLLLAVFAGFLMLSFRYGAKARMIPIPVAVVSMLLVAAQLILQNTRHGVHLNIDPAEFFRGGKGVDHAGAGQGAVSGEEGDAGSPSLDDTRTTKEPGGSEWTAIGMVALFVGMVWFLGLLAAVFLFVTGYVLLARRKWMVALMCGGAIEITVYAFFVNLLHLQVNDGWLFEFLNK